MKFKTKQKGCKKNQFHFLYRPIAKKEESFMAIPNLHPIHSKSPIWIQLFKKHTKKQPYI